VSQDLRRPFIALATAFAVGVACRPPTLAGDSGQAGESGGGGETAAGGSNAEGGAPDLGPPDLTLMTWNLENFPKSVETISRAAEVIVRERPAVVGVQELRDLTAWEALDDELGDYVRHVATDGDGYTTVGLLVDTTQVEVEPPNTVFVDDDDAFPRPMLAVRVHPLRGQPSFHLGIVHLKAQLDAESAARRRRACVKLAAWADAELSAGDANIIILGDYNDELGELGSEDVFGPMHDAGAFLTEPLAASGAFSYVPFERLIDHVYLRGEFEPRSDARIVREDEADSDYVDTVSDHLPVMALLRASPVD